MKKGGRERGEKRRKREREGGREREREEKRRDREREGGKGREREKEE